MIQRHASPSQIDLGLAILRIVTGLTFAAHGYQKFFLMGIDGTSGFFGQVGIPLPELTAMAVATLELVGGLILAAGFMTRLIAIPLAFDMLGAIIFVHAKNGFFAPTGIEFVLLLLISALALSLAGPGALSVDRATGARATRS